MVTAMGGRLSRRVHGNTEVLLVHLLRELVIVHLGRQVCHLTGLHLEVAELLLWLDHAHVDVLLVRCGDLLFLLL